MQVIQGVKVQIKTEELNKHLNERVVFHRGKAVAYGDKAEELLKMAPDEERHGKGSSGPVSELQRTHEHHRRRAIYFDFLSNHLVPDAVYELSETDMTNLEINQSLGY